MNIIGAFKSTVRKANFYYKTFLYRDQVYKKTSVILHLSMYLSPHLKRSESNNKIIALRVALLTWPENQENLKMFVFGVTFKWILDKIGGLPHFNLTGF